MRATSDRPPCSCRLISMKSAAVCASGGTVRTPSQRLRGVARRGRCRAQSLSPPSERGQPPWETVTKDDTATTSSSWGISLVLA
jgi:hypothetical protein